MVKFFLKAWNWIKRKWEPVGGQLLAAIPYFHFIEATRHTQSPISFSMWFRQKVIGNNKDAYWPMHHSSRVVNPKNVLIGTETCPGWEPGCYIQGIGTIKIGSYTEIARNVGIIAGNHDVYDLRTHLPSEVSIGNYCWIGMNAVILPGVELGDYTIVGAGAIVTRSFPEGYCVIAGNPARLIKKLDPEKCQFPNSENPYVGYHTQEEFESEIKPRLWI